MIRSLVTGGAGFIGSHMVQALLKKGHQVRVLDNFSTGKHENLAPVRNLIELLEGDLANEKTVQQSVKEIDFIFHMGAMPSVTRSVEDPLLVHQSNVQGTLLLLLAAREAKVKRLVYSSSSSIYGDQPELPKKEEMKPDPLSPYALSKLTGEYYCSIFHSIYGVPTVSLRYFNVFGPRQDPNSLYSAVIPRFVTKLMSKSSPIIYGDGKQTRDFTFIEDVIQANLKASDAPSKALGKAFNIAGGKSCSLLELLSEIQKILGFTCQPTFEPARAGDVRDSLASIQKAKEAFEFNPTHTLQQGLEKTVVWFVENWQKEKISHA